jgi:hypothetical protein
MGRYLPTGIFQNNFLHVYYRKNNFWVGYFKSFLNKIRFFKVCCLIHLGSAENAFFCVCVWVSSSTQIRLFTITKYGQNSLKIHPIIFWIKLDLTTQHTEYQGGSPHFTPKIRSGFIYYLARNTAKYLGIYTIRPKALQIFWV